MTSPGAHLFHTRPPLSGVSSASAFLFDCDGLLVATEDLFTAAEKAIFQDHGKVFMPHHKSQVLGRPIPEVGRIMSSMLQVAEQAEPFALRIRDHVRSAMEAPLPPLPGVSQVLKLIDKSKRPMAVVSNSPRELVERSLRAAELEGFFSAVVCLEDAELAKPAPDLYLAAAALLGVDIADCVAFEDSPTGIQSALSAGARVVGVSAHDAELAGTWYLPSLDDEELLVALRRLQPLERPSARGNT